MNKTSVARQMKTTIFLPRAQGSLQRKCVCGKHIIAGGECPKKKSTLQRKLTIGAGNDALEREADRNAEQVMTASAQSSVGGAPLGIQCLSGQATGQMITAPDSVDRTLASSGKALEPAVRQDMEQRFGYDFSRVRVHSGTEAEQSARDVNAHAYTVGQNIVFGAGGFTPETHQGRRLLAHELTHVVQQSKGSVEPMIQRRLLVTADKKADIKAMFDLLEPASGFRLKHDAKTNEVSVTASVLKPPSFVLADRLATIMDDPKQDAEIHLGRKQEGVHVGAFPSDLSKPVQEIRIDHILALEKGAPGSGVAKLAHEIVENYEGHALKDYNWNVAFDASHKKAVETEDLIESELGHPGSRRNTFSVVTDPGKGKPSFLRGIEDREKYFLVWDESFDRKGAISNVRRVPRVKVSTYKIEGFTAGSNTLPKAGAATITALAADLKTNPTASALVEGFAAAGTTADKNVRLAMEWADIVQNQVIEKVADKINTSWRRFHLVGSAAKSGNFVVITVERPDM